MAKRDAILPRIVNLARPTSRASVSGAAGPIASGKPATIAVYSVKGGVGKTTIAANLAWCSAASSNCRTLLWDLDAAGGAGFLYGLERRGKGRAQDIIAQACEPEELICSSGFEGLDVLPADESLRTLDRQFAQIGKRRRLARLTGKLGARYERILLDCPPVLNELSAQAMRAADLIIVPLPPSPLSARALDLVLREVAENGRRHPPILPIHSMIDMRRALHRQAHDANPAWPAIPYASAIEQCAVQGKPVGAVAPHSPAAQRFTGLWQAIESKLAERAD